MYQGLRKSWEPDTSLLVQSPHDWSECLMTGQKALYWFGAFITGPEVLVLAQRYHELPGSLVTGLGASRIVRRPTYWSGGLTDDFGDSSGGVQTSEKAFKPLYMETRATALIMTSHENSGLQSDCKASRPI